MSGDGSDRAAIEGRGVRGRRRHGSGARKADGWAEGGRWSVPAGKIGTRRPSASDQPAVPSIRKIRYVKLNLKAVEERVAPLAGRDSYDREFIFELLLAYGPPRIRSTPRP